MKKLLENLAALTIILATVAAFGWCIALHWEADPFMCVVLWGFQLAMAIQLYRGKS